MTAPTNASLPATLSHGETTAALADGAVVRWWQSTAFVEVAGPDAPSLLDGLCTQAVERIEPGGARLGLFLDAKAKVIAPAVLHRVADAPWRNPRREDEVEGAPVLLLETLPDLAETLAAHLTRYRLRARASVAAVDRSSIAIVGARATPPDVPVHGDWTELLDGSRPTVTFIGDRDSCAALVGTHLPQLGLGLADPDAVEADRIRAAEAGLHDLLPGRMPAEVGGMERAVALDAGCYLGQEPVARLHYRGHANRMLRPVVATGDAPIEPDGDDADEALALRRVDDPDATRPTGRLTTWAHDSDGRTIGLAVLRRELAAGTELALPTGAPTLRVADEAPQ